MAWHLRLRRWCSRVGVSALGLSILVALGSCSANPPKSQNDICAVFDQKRGWYKAARAAERKWKLPIHVGLAFMYKESSFVANAKPARRRILGLVPWTRPSSAYGYAQATDEAWADYKAQTDRWFVDRDDFDDAVDFIGWYNDRSARALGLNRGDAYHLYVAYYTGVGGYRAGRWKRSATIKGYAQRVADQASRYQRQLKRCR